MKYVMKLITIFTMVVASFVAHANEKEESFKQVSRLYMSIPGDPLYGINPKHVRHTKAVLTRNKNRLSLVIDSRKLDAGAYTIWVRAFNVPELCTGGEAVKGSVCSRGSDLSSGMGPAVPDNNGMSTSSVFWVGNTIVGNDGVAHISLSVNKGEWPGMVLSGQDTFKTNKQAIWNPLGAEIHVVIRSHGLVASAGGPIFFMNPDTGLPSSITQEEKDSFIVIGRQLTRALGNCAPFFPFNEDEDNCDDAQLAIFPAPTDS